VDLTQLVEAIKERLKMRDNQKIGKVLKKMLVARKGPDGISVLFGVKTSEQ